MNGHNTASSPAHPGWIPLVWVMAALSGATLVGWAMARSRRRAFVLPKGAGVPTLSLQRCPLHGIAYDAEKEVCPACAAGSTSTTR